MSLWQTNALSKVFIFGWRLVLNRLPTRINLEKHGVLYGLLNLVCPLCDEESEDSCHLFGDCPVSEVWWIEVIAWLHIVLPLETLPPIARILALEVTVNKRFKVDS